MFVLANYPIDDARIGSGVGLDTLASIVNINAMLNGGECRKLNCHMLVDALVSGVTNVSNLKRIIRASINIKLIDRDRLNIA